MFQYIDPVNFLDRIENIPKFITVSSDDEFMSMDWTNIYWDKITGEKHLLIAPNTEHFMVTGIWDIMSSMASNIRSVMMGIKKRTTFSYTFDNDTGGLTVTIPRDQEQPFEVSLRHGQTISKTMRDFRWMVEPNNFTQIVCEFPYIPSPISIKEKDLCIQPIIWEQTNLTASGQTESGDTYYYALPPEPKDGHWTGYYIDLKFPGDTPDYSTAFKNEFHRSTPGYTWPNTLPFEDCYGESCIGREV